MKKIKRADLFEFTVAKQLDERTFEFRYAVTHADGAVEKFRERLVLPFAVKALDSKAKRLLQQVHLAIGINYYKLYVPQKTKVPYHMTSNMANFWNKVYRLGLGEFAYLNGITPSTLGNFKANKSGTLNGNIAKVPAFDKSGHYLIGIGGGKDSLVAWELLQRADVRAVPFVCESPSHNNLLRREVVATLGSEKQIICERIPDPKLNGLRTSGKVFRGHSPMSAIVAFTAVFCAYLKKYDGFLVANESSSNEYNLSWRGVKINHQWTKTIYFEKAMNEYLAGIGLPMLYLSVVRPMNELMITGLFARMPQYHKAFFSCNKSLLDKAGHPVKWCADCAKCASATLLLAPFLSPAELEGIIGKNMLADERNATLFAELAGFTGNKPFECVCTKKEARAILQALHSNPEYSQLPVVRSLYNYYDDAEKVVTIEDLLKFSPNKDFPRSLTRLMKKVIASVERT